jgi:ribosomal protein S18 acetylase RimI-like enzyme
MVIRPARPDDLEALLALEQEFVGDRLSRRALRHHLRSPRAHYLVADIDGRLAGYVLELQRRGSRWWRVYSLIRAQDAPPGTGRRLLEAGIEAARAASAAGVRLEVREDNRAAIDLYRALGFTLFDMRDGYYEDGARALCMALAFDDCTLGTATRGNG